MPTYQYRCPMCGHEYEKLQSISDNSRARCPNCGTRGDRVITGGGGVIFKGSGFYLTDYGRAGQSKEKAEQGETAGKADQPDGARQPGEQKPKADQPSEKPAEKPRTKPKPKSDE